MTPSAATLPAYDLLVVGEINPDLILRGADLEPAFGQAEKRVDDAALTVGSSSVMAACGAARLGLRTAFVGVVGDELVWAVKQRERLPAAGHPRRVSRGQVHGQLWIEDHDVNLPEAVDLARDVGGGRGEEVVAHRHRADAHALQDCRR